MAFSFASNANPFALVLNFRLPELCPGIVNSIGLLRHRRDARRVLSVSGTSRERPFFVFELKTTWARAKPICDRSRVIASPLRLPVSRMNVKTGSTRGSNLMNTSSIKPDTYCCGRPGNPKILLPYAAAGGGDPSSDLPEILPKKQEAWQLLSRKIPGALDSPSDGVRGQKISALTHN